MIHKILFWNPKFMTLTDQPFFWFLIASVILYYSVGKKFQKFMLLVVSFSFYFTAAGITLRKLAAVVLFVIGVAYAGSIIIDKSNGKLRKILTWICVTTLVSMLFFLKSAYNVFSLFLEDPDKIAFMIFISLLGISYYTLSAIGYILDVSWGIYPAEKNPLNIALFVIFFPQLVSGPVTRYSQMREQFQAYHPLEYENIAYGLRRMIWGYFKKLVISERFALIVSTVYSDYVNYNGAYLVFATLCYAVQLYTDFSGCMDIIMGAANLFGYSLPENFDAPFFSVSLKEFWRRWHITLGTWFKDYVMYPLQMSGTMNRLGKTCAKYFGKKRGKKIPFYVSMFVLWTLIGLWHGGTAHYFIASGMIPFILLTLSDIMPSWASLDYDNVFCRIICRFRTVLLMCVSFVFICAGNVSNAFTVYRRIFTEFAAPVSAKLSLTDYLSSTDIAVMIAGLIIVLSADFLQDKKTSLTALIDHQKPLVQYCTIYAEILAIMFFGMMGSSSFIYFQF